MTVTKNGDGTYTLTPTAVEQKVIVALKLEWNSVPTNPDGSARPNATDARVLQTLVEGELRIQRSRLVALNAERRDAAYAAASASNQASADAAVGFVSWI